MFSFLHGALRPGALRPRCSGAFRARPLLFAGVTWDTSRLACLPREAQLACSRRHAATEASATIGAEELLRLSYASVMLAEQDEAEREVEAIVDAAAFFNARFEVTGQLSYDTALQQVWQVLEGKPEAVLTIWGLIKQDSRHRIDEESIRMDKVTQRRMSSGPIRRRPSLVWYGCSKLCGGS